MSWLSVKLGGFIYKALQEAKKAREKTDHSNSIAEPMLAKRAAEDPMDIPTKQTQFTVMKVANGRLIKVSEYTPTKSHHSDWTHEIYIVKDDEKVPDVIARIMAIKALEQ